MSLALHKIVGAIRAEENVLSAVSKIEHYSLSATSNVLTVREIAHVDGLMHMNGKATHVIASELAMGFTSSLRDVYKIDHIPRSLELRTIEDVKLRPSYMVGENIRFAQNKFAPELATKLDKEAKNIMNSTDLADEIKPEIVERNPALKNIFNKMSGKKVRTVGGTLLSIGVGVAAVCAAVNEHRNRLTACMLYYYNNDQLRRCVVATCTCKKIDCTKDCNYCSVEVQKQYLPADMLLSDNCKGFTGDSGCVKCPSENYNQANLSDDATLKVDNVAESSFVRCQKPNFYEAISDLFGGVSQDLMDIVKGSLTGVGWLVQKLPYIIIFAIVGIVIVIIISIYKKFSGRSSSSSDTVPIVINTK
ncbi:envelope component protein [Drosophila suzukii associated hytrosavirus 1]|nr:envelope component protein [Drosophila suzukii associated hytrosavirus 1]